MFPDPAQRVAVSLSGTAPAVPVIDPLPNIADAAALAPQHPRKIPRHSIVYDPALQTLTFDATETLVIMAGKATLFTHLYKRKLILTHLANNEVFEVPLPPWRNVVDIFTDAERTNFLGSAHLQKIGFNKNLQRRLGIDYTRLYVRAPPTSPPPQNVFPSARESTDSLLVLPRPRAVSSSSSLGTRVMMARSSQEPSSRPSPARSRKPSATSRSSQDPSGGPSPAGSRRPSAATSHSSQDPSRRQSPSRPRRPSAVSLQVPSPAGSASTSVSHRKKLSMEGRYPMPGEME